MKKVIILGFPHCGTSILKSIIGHCANVDEIYNETNTINRKSDNDFIVCKWPFVSESFFTPKYDDYIKIMIIRNPIYVFSSLNKRFDVIPKNHNISDYNNMLSYIHRDDVHLIKYENMFENNYQELKILFDKLGFIYNDNTFNNNLHKNVICDSVKLPTDKPNNKSHIHYRTWQINQSFHNNNKKENVNITKSQLQQLKSYNAIMLEYPEL